jgi:hypothetical protein
VYFEGAWRILQQLGAAQWGAQEIRLLYSGRLMLSELARVKRIAHLRYEQAGGGERETAPHRAAPRRTAPHCSLWAVAIDCAAALWLLF